ncbi:hypothetical protein K438DRAFT_1762094 [Mycena galopus ATCC 62051]|nr:hypothetical protein K438DRAFT_1762094 [Mycena galopus ATCC 62051]
MNDIYIAIIFWALSYVPGTTFHYIILGLVTASATIFYVANRQSPTYKLRCVGDAIEVTKKILEHGRATCARGQVDLMYSGWRLAGVKLSASKIQTRLLETRSGETWGEYVQNVREILQSINKCAKKVKEIQTSILLSIEAERQRQISEDIEHARDTIDATIYSSRRLCVGHERTLAGLTRRRHFEFEPTENTSMRVSQT